MFDFVFLTRALHKRTVNKILLDAAIIANPHTKKPDELINKIREFLPPEEFIDNSPKDSEGIARLRDRLAGK